MYVFVLCETGKNTEMEKQEMKKKLTITYFPLPQELMVEVLLRLPVKSLLRFKCVCKSWFSVISDPKFAISHFDLAAAPSHRLLLRSTTGSIKAYGCIGIDASASVSFLPLRSTTRSVKSIDLDASLRDVSSVVNLLLPPPPPSLPPEDNDSLRDVEILGSCGGLVLLLYPRGDLALWNPSIDIHKRIPPAPFGVEYYHGFGYDASTDDYIVFFMSFFTALNSDNQINIQFFSSKSNSWHVKYDGVSSRYRPLGYDLCYELLVGIPLNGALHWLVSSDKVERVIIGLDLIERDLFEIPLPHDMISEPKYGLCPPRLRTMGGHLALCYPGAWKKDEVEIWVMKEYKVSSSWTKSIVISTCSNIPHSSFFPIYFPKGGGIFGTLGHGRLVKLSDNGQLLEDLRYGYHGVDGFYADNLHSALYRESLLSPPVDFGEARQDDQQ